MMQSSPEIALLDTLKLPWPVDWPQLFGRPAPLFLELGFGNGEFLVDLAGRHPEANILGAEIALPAIRRAEKRIKQRGLTHARLARATAVYTLWSLCAPATISRLIINFPDPWPKDRHHHRRLVNPRFLQLAASRLLPGAHLDLATDHQEYSQAIAACLQDSGHFESRRSVPFVVQDKPRGLTKYERKALAAGRPCYYFHWRRNDAPAPNPFPVPREVSMPHVLLRTHLSLEEITARFEPQQWRQGRLHVRFISLYRATQENALLLDLYINEEAVEQRIGLFLRRRAGDELLISLHEIGFPRVTEGVHMAVDYLARWILTLDPSAIIVYSNVTGNY